MTAIWRCILAVILLLPALASAQDLKSIAGRWAGEGGQKGSTRAGANFSRVAPVELTINEDGTAGEFFLPLSNFKTPATFTVTDGKIRYETAAVTGVITLSEVAGKRVLKGESKRKDGTGEGWFEVKPKM